MAYLVTMAHEATIRIQAVKYPTIKAAEEDAAKHDFKIQAVQKISKKAAA